MTEDKNLNGVMDDEEVIESTEEAETFVEDAPEFEVSQEAVDHLEEVINTGEAEGNTTSEEVSEEVVALALTVKLTFGDEVVELDVTENFQLDLRKVCNDQGSRYDEFEVEGDLDPTNLRLLMKALK